MKVVPLLFLGIGMSLWASSLSALEEIMPYKFTDKEVLSKISYSIPASSRFTIKRAEENSPDIVYYFSSPKGKEIFPIAILCSGSSTKNDVSSIIHFHRYFLQEFLDLGSGVITLEQWGIDGNSLNKKDFMTHYTRSQRLHDHQTVIDFLISHLPTGWNGKLIFLGISEGGPLVTHLTGLYPEKTIATLNWAGAVDESWDKQMWTFMEDLRKKASWRLKLQSLLPRWVPFSLDFPKTSKEYEVRMQGILKNPTPKKEFMGMTHRYHADALQTPSYDYKKLKTPFLVVSGTQDSIINSTDTFVQKAQEAGALVTYLRVEDMDHYIRKRPDIIRRSFEWLKKWMDAENIHPLIFDKSS